MFERDLNVWVATHPKFGRRVVLKTTTAACLKEQGWKVVEYVPRQQLESTNVAV
jgi:hypothetical protein